MQKRPRKVKVFGLDSSKSTRARLIEILMERVMYHKDKFVAPIIHQEMQAMQIKKNGKVEHSDKSHDDQVFSYLMALYVWYDGKNLVENFGIRKSSLRTDSDEELEEIELEDALEKKERVDFSRISEFEGKQDILEDLDWLEKDTVRYKTSADLELEQYLSRIENRNIMLVSDPKLASSVELQTGINVVSYQAAGRAGSGFMTIPSAVFNLDDDSVFDNDPDFAGDDFNTQHTNRSHLVGNLSGYYDML